MVDRETFDRIKLKHGGYASWAVWAPTTGRAKSGIGDLDVLDPDRNPTLLETLRNDVVMLGLNLARDRPRPLGNFHDFRGRAQDFKIRYAFAGTPYYSAYMTDLIKEVVELKASNAVRQFKESALLVGRNLQVLFDELTDLRCNAPTIIAFGGDVYRLARDIVPANQYSHLVRVRHYSDYSRSKEEYREEVLADLASAR